MYVLKLQFLYVFIIYLTIQGTKGSAIRSFYISMVANIGMLPFLLIIVWKELLSTSSIATVLVSIFI